MTQAYYGAEKDERIRNLQAVADAAQAFYVRLVDAKPGEEWNLAPAIDEWLALQDALREVRAGLSADAR